MDYLSWAKDTFKNDIYATQTTGIQIVEVDLSYAKCELQIEPKHKNAANQVMGGVIFTLADFTFAIAANVENALTVSLSSQIQYIGTAKGDTLISTAKCIKSGRSTCFFEIIVMDNLNNTVAVVTTTGFRKTTSL